MPRKTGVLIFAILLLLASFAAEWYADGGTRETLSVSDSRVAAAFQYLTTQSATARLATEGEFLQAWVSEGGSGYDVYVAVESNGNPYLTWVRFNESGSPVSSGLKLWSGRIYPVHLRNLSIVFFVLWVFAAFVAPHVWSVKCPDCPPSFISPPVTEAHEITVYPGGFTKDGDELGEIIRRDFICPRCGYRKITYDIVMPRSGGFGTRAGVLRRWTGMGMLLNPKELDWYDRVLNKNLDDREAGRGLKFPTREDWQAFYDELKASEREEHGRN